MLRRLTNTGLRLAVLSLAVLVLSPAQRAVAAETAEGVEAPLNRLANEASPYLRQHARNPIDWYPWGEEAFRKARDEDKPILLSVGYSTCHWCHVMARETYSDTEVAAYLNANFVAIKVDRERRPDVDETYMLATQLFAQIGGWPNNVFLTPDLKPFYGGVYFPRDAFFDLLRQVMASWVTNRLDVNAEADRAAGLIHRVMTHRAEAEEISPEVLARFAAQMPAAFDPEHGGLGTAPKFPREFLLMFLLDQAETADNTVALSLVTDTLDAMLKGGIWDLVGGGIHRYTVDREWRTPHYEIMLYNQANVVRVLLQAYRLTRNEDYAHAARDILDFVLREMTAPGGGFYAAFDAESRNAAGALEEGYYFTWRRDELAQALSVEDAALAARIFGFEDPMDFKERRTLRLDAPVGQLAAAENMSPADLQSRLRAIRRSLLDARKQRAQPHRDNKVLTGWNSLMIRAFADASAVLGEPKYLSAAVRAGEFFWNELGGETGTLKRYDFEGARDLDATQPDYALLALAYLSIHDAMTATTPGHGATCEAWLTRAIMLAKRMDEIFLDTAVGDYFMTADDVFYRPKIMVETDLPSGNAAALELFARLHRRDLSPDHRASADRILAVISGNLVEAPMENTYALRVANQFLRQETGPISQIAGGRVRARASIDDGNRMRVDLDIADGWHINSSEPLDENFIPTSVTFNGVEIGTVTYPPAKISKLGFNAEPLALYESRVSITLEGDSPDVNWPTHTTLTLQACNDEICLEPETVQVPVLLTAGG